MSNHSCFILFLKLELIPLAMIPIRKETMLVCTYYQKPLIIKTILLRSKLSVKLLLQQRLQIIQVVTSVLGSLTICARQIILQEAIIYQIKGD